MRPSLPVPGTLTAGNSSNELKAGDRPWRLCSLVDWINGLVIAPSLERLKLLLIFAFLLSHLGAAALALPPAERGGDVVLDRYFAATKDQQSKLSDLAMEVEMEASLPKLNKSGKLHAWRYVTKLGAITYRALTIQGDNTVKKDVIARYLQAEKEAGEKPGLGINRENYKFHYRGEYPWGASKLHLFFLEPRRKQVGLFEGWVWIDNATWLPVREQGELAKSPSVFLKKVAFVRDYIHQDGVAIPVSIESSIQTRIVGSAEVKIRYTNISKQARPEKVVTSANR
jgi:hypothetical protein